jgi:hypothetical protein
MNKLYFSFFLLVSSHAFATDLILSGADTSKNSSYYYLGYITPLEGSELGKGFVNRFWLDYISYDYASGSNTVQASAPGISYSIGFQKTLDKLSFGAFLGAEIRRTELSPIDYSNEAEGTKINPLISVEAQNKFSSFSVINFNASLKPNNMGYWTRVSLGFGDKFKTGPEVSIQGDSTYQTNKYGWFISGIDIGNQISIGGKLGMTKTDNTSYLPYIGLNLGKSF